MPNIPGFLAVCSCLVLLGGAPAPAQADRTVFDPFTGYRIAQYRAPVPDPPEGVPVVSADDLPALIDAGALLVDVFPLRSFHIGEDGAWIYPQAHASLPGAIWLPVVGWGVIEGWAEAYLRSSLAQEATPDAPVLVFCKSDCWLSWNAVQRVRDLGYDARWYPGGVDDWQAAGHDLVPVAPEPFQD